MDATNATRTKPQYLGLLNAISLAESAAGVYLEAWADVTPNADLAKTLRLVAARERSHGDVFCRRIAELGYELRRKPDPKAAAALARYANPDICDLDKLPPESESDANPFGEIRRGIAEGQFDPMTANLMTWYIAEELDSGRRLKEAYACVRAEAKAAAPAASGGPSADAQAMMACMAEGFSRLEKSIEKLAKAVK